MGKLLNLLLEDAVSEDNVKLAYIWIKLGADVNHKVPYHYETTDEGGPINEPNTITISWTRDEPPMFFATSEAMRKLLRSFGALSSEEVQAVWKQRDALDRVKEQKKKERKESCRQRKQQQDEAFVDRVTK